MRRCLLAWILLPALLVLLASCADETAPRRAPERVPSPEEEAALAREMLESYTGHLNAVLDELERVAPLGDDAAEGSAAASLSEVQDLRAAIQRHLAEVERRLAGEEAPPAEPSPEGRAERAPARGGPSEAEIVRLRREAAAAAEARAQTQRVAAEKAQLERSLDDAQAELDKLRARSSELEELSGAFVMALTRGELGAMRDRDHLRRRGIAPGTYEPTGQVLPLGATGRTIVAVDPTARAIFLGSRVSEARLLSAHRHYDELYSIQRRNGQMAVVVRDPTSFWRVSRYLIVEVE